MKTYIVNADIELEAMTEAEAEEIVMAMESFDFDNHATKDNVAYIAVREVKEIV